MRLDGVAIQNTFFMKAFKSCRFIHPRFSVMRTNYHLRNVILKNELQLRELHWCLVLLSPRL